MNESSPPPDPWKKRLWYLLFGVIGGTFLLYCLFSFWLRSISDPNLNREIPPPEISGSSQAEKIMQNGEMLRSDDRPTSNTVIVDASGREILNLGDFPHLSPTMRYLAETWVGAWNVLDRGMEANKNSSNIPRIRQKMFQGAEAFKEYLNFPLKWGRTSYQDAEIGEGRLYTSYGYSVGNLLYGEFPKEMLPYFTVLMELSYLSSDMHYRMCAEVAIRYGEWREAVQYLSSINTFRRCEEHYDSLPVTQQCWEDELFCWRQMGSAGRAGVIARSYQESIPRPRYPNLTNNLMHLPAEFVWERIVNEQWRESETSSQNQKEPAQTEP